MSPAGWGAEVVAFAILIWVVIRYVVPFMRKNMTARQQLIREQLEESREVKARMEQAEAEFRRAHEGLDVEAARLRDDARTQSEQIVEELQERARVESARILRRGEDQLAAERDAVARQMRTDAGRLAVELAEVVVTEFLRDEPRRRASVMRALDRIAAEGGDEAELDEPALVPAVTAEETF